MFGRVESGLGLGAVLVIAFGLAMSANPAAIPEGNCWPACSLAWICRGFRVRDSRPGRRGATDY
jgi:hypothetical protein